ncbi:hypothetical protein Q3G72_034617 [Acer saccharum]|nr:hypothetical protein Q3G72_034617 [Acer saccharum]
MDINKQFLLYRQTAAGNAIRAVTDQGMQRAEVMIKGPGLGRDAALRAIRINIGCTQCVRACPTDVLEMIPWDGCKAKQIASAPRMEDCVGCKRCESACPTDFLSVRVYLWHETTRSMGLAY